MTNIELNKDHNGKLNLAVSGHYALGAEFSTIQNVNGEHIAIIAIPIKHIEFGSVSNVVPFIRAEGRETKS